MRYLLLLLCCIFLLACNPAATPTPEGEAIGDMPLIEGGRRVERATLSNIMLTIGQVHRETVDEPQVDYIHVEAPFIDTVDYYDKELTRLKWKLVDVLQFGDGGIVRRYHRGTQRAILAFHPNETGGVDVMLLQGVIY